MFFVVKMELIDFFPWNPTEMQLKSHLLFSHFEFLGIQWVNQKMLLEVSLRYSYVTSTFLSKRYDEKNAIYVEKDYDFIEEYFLFLEEAKGVVSGPTKRRICNADMIIPKTRFQKHF